MGLQSGLTLVLVNLNGSGEAGAMREPIDSNRSFPETSTFIIVYGCIRNFAKHARL